MKAQIKSKIILLYFKLCGICHFSHYTQATPVRMKRWFLIWTLLHICVLTTIVVFTISHIDHIFIMSDMVSAFTDIIQWALPVLSQYITIVESLLTERLRHRFWQHILYMDTHLLNTSSRRLQCSLNRYIRKAIAMLVTTVSIEVFIIWRIALNSAWRRHFFVSLYTFIICRSQVLFCVYFIDMLKCRTAMMKDRLNEMQSAGKHVNALNMMRCYKQCYGMMWQCLQDINKAFGWSLLLTVISCFVCISVGMYWGFTTLYFKTSPFAFESFLSTVPHFLSVYTMFHSVESFRFQRRAMSIRLHRIKCDTKHVLLKRLVSLRLILNAHFFNHIFFSI